MQVKYFWLLFAAVITLQLSACGFHLRGNSQIAERFSPLFVMQEQLKPEQMTLIRKQLTRSSAVLADSANGSNKLWVKLTPLKNRKIASSSLTDVELIQLRMNIQFSVQAKSGAYLLPQQELIQTADVELDNANILAHEQTINRAQQGLIRKLIQSMIVKLSR